MAWILTEDERAILIHTRDRAARNVYVTDINDDEAMQGLVRKRLMRQLDGVEWIPGDLFTFTDDGLEAIDAEGEE